MATPVITSVNNASVQSGHTGVVLTVTATDSDGDTITYSLRSGRGAEDEGNFDIDSNTGELTFITPPTYDANGSNNYEIVVNAFDGSGNGSQTVYITVTEATPVSGLSINPGNRQGAPHQFIRVDGIYPVNANHSGSASSFLVSGNPDGAVMELVVVNPLKEVVPMVDGSNNPVIVVPNTQDVIKHGAGKLFYIRVTQTSANTLMVFESYPL